MRKLVKPVSFVNTEKIIIILLAIIAYFARAELDESREFRADIQDILIKMRVIDENHNIRLVTLERRIVQR